MEQRLFRKARKPCIRKKALIPNNGSVPRQIESDAQQETESLSGVRSQVKAV